MLPKVTPIFDYYFDKFKAKYPNSDSLSAFLTFCKEELKTNPVSTISFGAPGYVLRLANSDDVAMIAEAVATGKTNTPPMGQNGISVIGGQA